jgi:hypothetical protein
MFGAGLDLSLRASSGTGVSARLGWQRAGAVCACPPWGHEDRAEDVGAPRRFSVSTLWREVLLAQQWTVSRVLFRASLRRTGEDHSSRPTVAGRLEHSDPDAPAR